MNSDEVSWLFIDLNSYFASVEQELRPELRGRPIAVIPVEADTTCCIAVSYQAKAYGLQTGMAVKEARARCPHIVFVNARHRTYVEFHHQIKAAIERCVPIQEVMSCDEFACQLLGRERQTSQAVALAYAIKSEIRSVGSTLRCSIGLGPNRLLAKMATEVQKPDGLMLFESHTLPHALYGFPLSAIPGIGSRMEKRLASSGITTMRQLCAQPRQRMHTLWSGVLGDRLWLRLRGEDFDEPATLPLQTFSRQHILPPHCREPERARAVAIKLLHAASRRMRENQRWAKGLFLDIGFVSRQQALQATIHFAPTQSPALLQGHLTELWKELPAGWNPSDLTVGLCNLVSNPADSLFEGPLGAKERVTSTLDTLNAKYGLDTVYLGSIHNVRKEAPTRISFGAPPSLEDFEDIDPPD